MPRLEFIVGGGAFLTFDYRVLGGPDHGRRVELLPKYRDSRALDYGASVYNGSREEYTRDYVECRPCFRDLYDGKGPLHPETLALISAILSDVR